MLWTTYDLLMIGTLDTTDLRISFQAYFLKFMRYRENADPGVWKAVMNVNDLMMERLETVCRVYISAIKKTPDHIQEENKLATASRQAMNKPRTRVVWRYDLQGGRVFAFWEG